MRKLEPWQHPWSTAFRVEVVDGVERPVRACSRSGCPWEMLSSKNRNRYRNGPNGKWMHAPKDCEGKDVMNHNWPKGAGMCMNPGCDVARARSVASLRAWRYYVDGTRLPDQGPCLGKKEKP